MQKLFSEFSPSTYKDWEQQVTKELKGESPEKLIWDNENGFRIKAYYCPEDISENYQPAFSHSDWEVCVQHLGNSATVNKKFLGDLQRGATAISFRAKDLDVASVLNDIGLEHISTAVFTEAEKSIELKDYLDKNYSGKDPRISLFPETFENLNDLQSWKKVHERFSDHANIKTFSVDLSGEDVQNTLPYYELALAFAMASESLNAFDSKQVRGLEKNLVIRTSVNTDFFMQIAKLRAYRRLWNILKKEYGLNSSLYLIAESSSGILSLSDRFNNLLRNSLAAISAVIGGCNELLMLGYDSLLNQNPALSERMAINQQLILKHESYLDQMADLSCGSYYIESLTDQLASKALDAFKGLESRGGYFDCLKSGEIAAELKQQKEQRAKAIESGNEIRIGVNKFPNEKDQLDLDEQTLALLRTLADSHPLLKYELNKLVKA